MPVETGVSDDLRSGFVLAHTDAVADETGSYTQQRFHILYEAPDFDGNPAAPEVFMVQGIVRFFEQATNGTLKMVLIFAKALWNYKQDEQPGN